MSRGWFNYNIEFSEEEGRHASILIGSVTTGPNGDEVRVMSVCVCGGGGSHPGLAQLKCKLYSE